MDTLLKIGKYVVIYPIIFPVLLFYEIGKFVWPKAANWREFSAHVIFVAVGGPIVSILSGIEFAVYLGWTLHFHWMMWTTAWFAYQLGFIGLIVPIVGMLTRPVFILLDSVFGYIRRVLVLVDSSIWRYSAFVGCYSPFISSFWRKVLEPPTKNNTQSNRWSALCAPWLLAGCHLFMIGCKVFLLQGIYLELIWESVTSYLRGLLFWTTSVTLWVVIITAMISPLLPFLLFGLNRLHAYYCIHQVYGSTAMLGVLCIMKYFAAELAHFSWRQYCIGGFISFWLLFIYVLPILGMLSTRRFIRDILMVVVIRANQAWRKGYNLAKEKHFLQSLNTFLVLMAALFTWHLTQRAGIHPLIAGVHIGLVVLFFFCVTTVDAVIVFINISFGYWISEFLSSFLETGFFWQLVIFAGGLVAGYWVVFPLIIFPLYWILRWTPRLVLKPIALLRHFVIARWSKFLGKLEQSGTYAWNDRTLYNPMFGWLLTTALVSVAVISYGNFYFASENPLALALTQAKHTLVPDILVWFGPYNPNSTVTMADSTRTITNNSTGTMTNSTGTITNSTGTIAHLMNATAGALFGRVIIDYIVFVTVLGNTLMLLGKFASTSAGVSFSWVIGILTFIQLRQYMLISSRYYLLSMFIAFEIAMLVALTITPAIYSLGKYLSRNSIPHIAPIIITPFEKLWGIYRWFFRIAVRQYYHLLDLVVVVWLVVLQLIDGIKGRTHTRPVLQRRARPN